MSEFEIWSPPRVFLDAAGSTADGGDVFSNEMLRLAQRNSDTLQVIVRTRVGRAILDLLRHGIVVTSHKKYRDDQGEGFPADALAFCVARRYRDAVERGEHPSMSDDPRTVEREDLEREQRVTGTGRGTGSKIYMWPERIDAQPVRYDGVLVHELAHALRNSLAVNSGRPYLAPTLGGAYWFPNVEEYFATLLQNMYASERGYGLSGGYSGAEGSGRLVPPGGSLNTPGRTRRGADGTGPAPSFFPEIEARRIEREAIRYLMGFTQLDGLFGRLRQLPPSIRYNPVRWFFEAEGFGYLRPGRREGRPLAP